MKKLNIFISFVLLIAVATSCSNDEEYVTVNTNYTELFTFIYDIKSTFQGYSAGEHCRVPLNVNDVRIYARILQ